MAKLQEHHRCPNPVQYGSSPIRTVYVRDTDSGKAKWKPVGFICIGCGVFRAVPGWYPYGKTEPVCEPWQPASEAFTEGPITKADDSAHDGDEDLAGAPGFETDLPTGEDIDQAEKEALEIEYPAVNMVLDKTYRFRHRRHGWADITAGTPGAALAFLGWDPEDVDIWKVWKSSGKIGSGGSVTAGWGKLAELVPAAKIRKRHNSRVRVTTHSLAVLLGKNEEDIKKWVNTRELPVEKDKHRHWTVEQSWYNEQVKQGG